MEMTDNANCFAAEKVEVEKTIARVQGRKFEKKSFSEKIRSKLCWMSMDNGVMAQTANGE